MQKWTSHTPGGAGGGRGGYSNAYIHTLIIHGSLTSTLPFFGNL